MWTKRLNGSLDKTWSVFKSTGCLSARNALVEHYLPAVWFLHRGRGPVQAASGTTLDAEDFVQDATISMMRVIELYQPQCGVKFETYLFRRLDNAMGRTRKRWLNRPVRSSAKHRGVQETTFTDARIDPDSLRDTRNDPDHNGDS